MKQVGRRKSFRILLVMALVSLKSFAEVEDDNAKKFDLSDYSFVKQVKDSLCDVAEYASGSKKPRKIPTFKNPYEMLSEEELKAKIKFLPSSRPLGPKSKDIVPVVARVALQNDYQIEIYLPENRCQTGWIKWGDSKNGYTKCPVLGRGESVLGSLKLLAGLQQSVADFKGWQLSENSGGFTEKTVKPNSRFYGESDLGYCLSRPESQTNGATITQRPNSTIGSYEILTGRSIHAGKESWGTVPGSNKLLIPLKMLKIPDSRNNQYANEGILISRDDFWVHSHENERDEWSLEALNTWGCPRLSRHCEVAIQKWTANEINEGHAISLKVEEQDARALNFEME